MKIRLVHIRTHSLLFGLLLLASCASTPTPEKSSATQSYQKVEELLALSKSGTAEERNQYRLKAAQLLWQEKKYDLAEQLLKEIDSRALDANLLVDYLELRVAVLLKKGNNTAAMEALNANSVISKTDSMAKPKRILLSQLRARVLDRLGEHNTSAQERIFLLPLLSDDITLRRKHEKAIWRSLMNIPTEELNSLVNSTLSEDYRAWLQLAVIAKSSQSDLDEQANQLDQWQQRWPNHPANQELPGELAIIRELSSAQPKKLALILPLSGRLSPYGKAIRDGFFASALTAKQNGKTIPEIQLYDSGAGETITAIHDRAISDGAEMIIGPLDKNKIAELALHPGLSVPVLALNRADIIPPLSTDLFQFGLAPEDEAAQIAAIAFLENHQKTLILASSGEWSNNIVDTFQANWQQLDGEIVDSARFDNPKNYSQTVKSLLQVDRSEQRAKRLRQLLGKNLEFTPRRRQDADMIFLLARPNEARALKPLIEFHYGSKLPVYATSRIYSGFPAKQQDRDLNGIKFVDIPWVVDRKISLKKRVNSLLANQQSFQRMYALGADSFNLYPRIRQLLLVPGSSFFGYTGKLQLNSDKQIVRELELAQIRGGLARKRPIPDGSLR